MRLSQVFLLATALVVAGCSDSRQAGKSSAHTPIMGTWKLVRYDNVAPAVVPATGALAVWVVFDDESVWSFIPMRTIATRGDYKIKGDTIRVSVGISKDTTSPRKLKFYGDSFMEMTYADGSIAFFHRLSDKTRPDADDSVRPPEAVPVSVQGDDYDAAFVQRVKEAMVHFAPTDEARKALVGRWDSTEDGRLRMEIGDNGVVAVGARGADGNYILLARGVIQADATALQSDALNDSGLVFYSLNESGELNLTLGATTTMVLRRR